MINGANLNGQIKCSVLMLSYFTFFYESHLSLNVLAASHHTSVSGDLKVTEERWCSWLPCKELNLILTFPGYFKSTVLHCQSLNKQLLYMPRESTTGRCGCRKPRKMAFSLQLWGPSYMHYTWKIEHFYFDTLYNCCLYICYHRHHYHCYRET